jgi:Rrf2 family protein
MFNKETEYALRSLVYIQAKNLMGKRPGVDEIARGTETPRFFIAKILHRLVKSGFLLSLKGKGGGFFLDEEQSGTKLLNIVNTIEGPNIYSGCVFGLKHCDADNPCPLHEKYAVIRDSIESLLSMETVLSLAERYPVYREPDQHNS